jgi:5-methyltetrahydropteroyltriglutamate--homocysteine methyltransferase
MSITVSTLGFPRIGPRRELKSALERFWAGKTNAQSLLADAAGLRAASWARQRSLGVTHIPSNDFSLYDHVLDTSVMVGAIPEIYGWRGGEVSIDTYFAMARGTHDDAEDCASLGTHKHDLAALEMTKWFDNNYHYMVP